MPEKLVNRIDKKENLTYSLATLYKLKCNQPVTTVPTVGFNVECYMQGNIKLNIWVIYFYCGYDFKFCLLRISEDKIKFDHFGVIIMLVAKD